jgi:formate dehydrogenase major subunit
MVVAPRMSGSTAGTLASDWATNCPEYKVTAVQATRVSQPGQWQKRFRAFSEVVPNPVPAAEVFSVK